MTATGHTPEPDPAASLLTDCQGYATALRKAEKMIHARYRVAGGDAQGQNVEFWDSAATQTLGSYLHAAALSGLPASSVRAWLAGPAHSITAAEILAAHPGASSQAAITLRGVLDLTPSKTAEVIRYIAAAAFALATSHRLT